MTQSFYGSMTTLDTMLEKHAILLHLQSKQDIAQSPSIDLLPACDCRNMITAATALLHTWQEASDWKAGPKNQGMLPPDVSADMQ